MPGGDAGPIVPGIVIEPFDPGRHDRSGFSCRTDRLDNFLRFTARKQQKDDFTRAFVAVDEGSPQVPGYYALNAHAVPTADLGADRPRRAPSTGSIPALYLSISRSRSMLPPIREADALIASRARVPVGQLSAPDAMNRRPRTAGRDLRTRRPTRPRWLCDRANRPRG